MFTILSLKGYHQSERMLSFELGAIANIILDTKTGLIMVKIPLILLLIVKASILLSTNVIKTQK